jgi:DNA-binding CsgD family transcriptional regulator
MNGQNLKRFSKAVLALHDCQEPSKLGESLLAAMRALCGADDYTVNSIGPAKLSLCAATTDYTEQEVEIFNAHLCEHPSISLIEQGREGGFGVGRWSDFTSLRAFRQKALYHDFFRLLNIQHQLACTVYINPEITLGLAFNRASDDFKQEDAKLLELLVPHVRQVVGNLVGRLEVERALSLREVAVGGDAVMVVNPENVPLFITEKARRLMGDYFCDWKPKILPPALVAWLQSNPASGDRLVCEQSGGRLVCVCGELTEWRDVMALIHNKGLGRETVRCIHLSERNDAKAARSLLYLGLTPREAEVLYWMSEGKHNSEIAIILSISERTVDKHREHLFIKLGVDNRTSAVAMAWEILRRT